MTPRRGADLPISVGLVAPAVVLIIVVIGGWLGSDRARLTSAQPKLRVEPK
jgi:cytochrome b